MLAENDAIIMKSMHTKHDDVIKWKHFPRYWQFVGELFMRSRDCYFGVYSPSCAATMEINTKITLEWAHKEFGTRVHTLCHFLHDITNPYMTLKTRIFTHHSRVSLARFTFCWWCHNLSVMMPQWPDNCDANTWQVISNSLDIDFIHGDIHGRSCKKYH